jgi:hypothetical protein
LVQQTNVADEFWKKCRIGPLQQGPAECDDRYSKRQGGEMRNFGVVALAAFVAVELHFHGATARADDGKIPSPSCPINSPCYQSYTQGHQQLMDEWLSMDRSAPRSFENLVGPFSYQPQQAANVCINALGAANAGGAPPADPRAFRGGCMDVELAVWQNEGQIDVPTRLQLSFHR